ncbi:hypothetical protein J6590_017711 [Homalodisca vitripennis]|nr:hypothetical protein J6590_017711 [Homalodisca vitripennis]
MKRFAQRMPTICEHREPAGADSMVSVRYAGERIAVIPPRRPSPPPDMVLILSAKTAVPERGVEAWNKSRKSLLLWTIYGKERARNGYNG